MELGTKVDELLMLREERDALASVLSRMQIAQIELDQQLSALASRLEALEQLVRHDQHRLDYTLSGHEGVLSEIDAFHAIRASPEYQAAFTEPNPLVSICVTTANRPDLLINRSLRSLQEQTYRNLQIIVVGDHCIDDTERRV